MAKKGVKHSETHTFEQTPTGKKRAMCPNKLQPAHYQSYVFAPNCCVFTFLCMFHLVLMLSLIPLLAHAPSTASGRDKENEQTCTKKPKRRGNSFAGLSRNNLFSLALAYMRKCSV